MTNNKKHILIYAHYYTPDVASTGQILTELAEGLLKDFKVTVICVVPSYSGHIDQAYKEKKYYRENINGVDVLRVRVPEFSKQNKKSRIKNILAYYFRAIWATTEVKDVDIVFSISQPPILGGLLGVLGKWMKRSKFVYNIQDFNPEQTIAVSYSKNKAILKLMLMLDKFSCKRSDLVITVGRDLVERMNQRFNNKKVPNAIMINNWINEKEVYPLEATNQRVKDFKEEYGLLNKFVIMYSGNIGLYYDLENIIKVIGKFKDYKDVAFAFAGDGSVLNNLKEYKEQNNLNNVVFIPYQNKEDLIYSLNAADVHWCVNAKGIKGVSVPSKVYGIMAVAKPILGVLEKGTEARSLIEEIDCGIVSDPEDYIEIESAINEFLSLEKRDLALMGERGRAYLEKNLTEEVSIGKYAEALKCLVE